MDTERRSRYSKEHGPLAHHTQEHYERGVGLLGGRERTEEARMRDGAKERLDVECGGV